MADELTQENTSPKWLSEDVAKGLIVGSVLLSTAANAKRFDVGNAQGKVEARINAALIGLGLGFTTHVGLTYIHHPDIKWTIGALLTPSLLTEIYIWMRGISTEL